MIVQIKSRKTGNRVELTYADDTADLLKVEFLDVTETVAIRWMLSQIPAQVDDVAQVFETRLFEITTVSKPVSFDQFWEAYDYKVGRKKAENVWEKMTEAQLAKAFTAIKPYNYHLATNPRAKLHPETYLRNERYNDDYSKK